MHCNSPLVDAVTRELDVDEVLLSAAAGRPCRRCAFSPLLHASPTRAPQEDFDAKVAFVKSWTYGGSKVTNDEKLTCYGLYKRVAPAPARAQPRADARGAGR